MSYIPLDIGSSIGGSSVVGSVLFVGVGNLLQQDNALFWDNTNNRLGIGTNTPGTTLELADGSTSVAIALQAGQSAAVSAAGTGRLRFNATTNKFQISENGAAYADIATSVSASIDIGDAIGSSTPGSVLFVGAANDLQQDNANFFWDNTNKRLGIRTTPRYTLDIVSPSIAEMPRISPDSGPASSYMQAREVDSDDTFLCVFGVDFTGLEFGTGIAAGGISVGPRGTGNDRDMVIGLYSNTQRMRFYNGISAGLNLERATILATGFVGIAATDPTTALDIGSNNLTANTAAIAMRAGQSAAVSTASTGRIRYNASTQKFQVSENGAAFADLSSGGSMSIGGSVGSSTVGSILFVGAGNVLAQDNANVFWDDTNNRLGLGTTGPTTTLDLTDGATSAAIAMRAGQSAAVSSASTGRIRYNATSNKFQVSENGAAYADIQSGAAFTIDIGDAIGSSTVGSVLFVGAGNVLQQDNTNFFWDDTNNRLGLGTATPRYRLELSSSLAQSPHFFPNAVGPASSTLSIHDGSDPANSCLCAIGMDHNGSTFGTSTACGGMTVGKSGTGTEYDMGFVLYSTTKRIRFHTNVSAGLSLERVSILATGFFGIAATDPAVALDIGSNNLTANTAGINLRNGVSLAVSAASNGRLIYNATAQKFQVSENGVAYASIISGSLNTFLTGITGATTISTASGALTLTSAAAATWSTAAGALTLTSAAAATWSTAAGTLSINGTGALSLQSSGVGAISIGTAAANAITVGGATSLLGFFGATAIVQPSSTGELTGFTANTSANAVFNESTWTGNVGTKAYTVSDVVKHLKNLGHLAAS